jgi:hypothetical protein
VSYREVHVVEVREVVRLWSRGESLRSISRLTGLDRKTVRRYVKAAQQAGCKVGEAAGDAVVGEVIGRVRAQGPGVRGTARRCVGAFQLDGEAFRRPGFAFRLLFLASQPSRSAFQWGGRASGRVRALFQQASPMSQEAGPMFPLGGIVIRALERMFQHRGVAFQITEIMIQKPVGTIRLLFCVPKEQIWNIGSGG